MSCPHREGERIFGIETEFGTLVSGEVGTPEEVVELIKDHVFYDLKLGAIDLHPSFQRKVLTKSTQQRLELRCYTL